MSLIDALHQPTVLTVAVMVGVKAHSRESLGHRVWFHFGHSGKVIDDFVGGLDFHTGAGSLGRAKTKQIVHEHPEPTGLRCALFSFHCQDDLFLEG